MKGRLLNERELRILNNRESNLKDVVRGFKALVDGEYSQAPQSIQIDARRTRWELTEFRSLMGREMECLARYCIQYRKFPPDNDIRVARIALAMYLLDKTEEMLDAAIERKNPALTSLFISAFASIRNIIDSEYFRKTPGRIMDDYLDNESAIVACAACAEVPLLSLQLALREYHIPAADAIDEVADSLPDVA